MSDITEAVINHHLHAFREGDIDGLMSDYTEGSILITPQRTLRNLNEICALFNKFIIDVVPPACDFELSQKIIDGNIGYLIWSAESDNYRVPFGTDTFIINDGKIVTQTVAMVLEAKY